MGFMICGKYWEKGEGFGSNWSQCSPDKCNQMGMYSEGYTVPVALDAKEKLIVLEMMKHQRGLT
eukprot:6273979-Ditylum_brightwellii.AAC.2